ncbi:MAG TPA: DUF1501 domain-containing protein [Pirellulales bacterium]|jgi:hypothetical protein|nr:DUF1501 domain-containing protein [Pirellulales bacterium]
MKWHLRHQVDVSVARGGAVSRRDFLRGISAASIAAGTLGWRDLVSLEAGELRKAGRACILLWMQGGPSPFETFSPKPGHANGGETKAISTAVPGLEVSENFPRVAAAMDRAAIIRSMTSKEGSHPRATYLMHTGYLPTASVKYPAFGSIAAQQIAHEGLELPAFVRVGGGGRDGGGGGILGVEYDPFLMPVAGKLPTNTALPTSPARHDRRLDLLARLEADYAATSAKQEVSEHRKLYEKASRMILSSQMKAFDLEHEPQKVREGYGESQFGLGCLLARRLVETGVPCVEVVLNGWDTHFDNFPRVKELAGQVDQPLAYLLADLAERGLLDNTLVVWMGEFGRTPKINPRAGRDHYPRAFNVLLAGGGVRGGQVIGKTDEGGAEVEDRPVAVADLFQTFCKSLQINPAAENIAPNGRPIKIVDGGKPVAELFA